MAPLMKCELGRDWAAKLFEKDWSLLARPHNAEIEYLNIVARKRRCWSPPQRSDAVQLAIHQFAWEFSFWSYMSIILPSWGWLQRQYNLCDCTYPLLPDHWLWKHYHNPGWNLGCTWTSWAVPNTGAGGGAWAVRLRRFHDLHHPQLRESLSSCGCALLQNGELYRYICLFVTWFSISIWGHV